MKTHTRMLHTTLLLLFMLLSGVVAGTGTVRAEGGSLPLHEWRSIGPYNGGVVLSLAIDPASSATVYAGTDGSGVVKSTNGGGLWSAANHGIENLSVYALTIDVASPETVYAGTNVGVFKSSDGGANWSPASTGISYVSVYSLAIDHTSPATLYAGTSNGLFKTSNAGGNWNPADSGLTNPYVRSLAIDPTSPLTVYAGTAGGVFKSADGGGSWEPASSGLGNLNVQALAINPDSSLTLYAATYGGVFKSTDGGGSWSPANTGITDLSIFSIAVDPTSSSTVYVGTYGGVFKSTDGGETWNPVNSGLENLSIHALTIDTTSPVVIYAGTHGGGIFKSTTAGASWNALNTGLSNLNVQAIINPAATGTLFAGTNSSVYKSTNDGASWSQANNGLANLNIQALAFDPITPTTLYAGTDGGVFKSSNTGGIWSAVNTGLSTPYIRSIAVDPVSPAIVYAGTNGGGVFKSTTAGGSWSEVNTGLTNLNAQALSIDLASPATVFVGTNGGGVFKSTDGGGNWSPANTGLGNLSVNALAIDPASSATVYAGTNGGGVFKSTDGGTSWSAINTGLTNPFIRCLSITTTSSGTLYAGTDGGLFTSTDGGMSWSPLNAGLPNLHIRSLGTDPASPATLYAGTGGSGVFKLNALDVVVSPAPFDFGNTVIPIPSVPQEITISNTGTTTLSVSSISLTGGDSTSFSLVTGSCPSLSPTIAAGGSCTVVVTFTPTLVGSKSVVLRIVSNSFNYPALDIPLSGTGIMQLYTLTFAANGTGSGSVNLSTGGSCIGNCSLAFASGTSVHLTPVADAGSVFASWSGCDSVADTVCTVTMNGTKDVTATFNAQPQEGAFYQWLNVGPTGQNITSIAVDLLTPTTVYAGAFGGVFLSNDGGMNWSTMNNGITNLDIRSLAFSPGPPASVYAGTNGGGIFRSVDNGAIWTPVNTGLTSMTVNTLAVDLTFPATIYAGTSGGVFKSTDGGDNWAPVNSGLTTPLVTSLIADPTNRIFAGTSGGGVFKSTDGGAHWVPMNTGLTDLSVTSLAIDPVTSAVVYAGTAAGGVFKSTDDGTTWVPVNTGLANPLVHSLATDPVAPDTVYAGTSGGVFMSTNGGTGWSPINAGLSNLFVTSLAPSPTTPVVVYAGTNGDGIFKLRYAGISVTPSPYDFGTVATYSASASQPLAISNTGTADLVVTAISATGPNSGEVTVTLGTCPSFTPTLAPGASCTVDVTFNPTTVGPKVAAVEIRSNAPAAPVKLVNLTGFAYDPPPFGTIAINGGGSSTRTTGVTLTLFAIDNSGIVAEMRFSNNNSSWSSWEIYSTTKSWNLDPLGGDGTKIVYVQFRDGAGNTSGSFFNHITLDTVPPTTTITAMPATLYTSHSGSVSFTANEAGATFECRLDAGTFAPCASPFAFSGLADGSHTFSVRATDPAGNMETVPQSYTWAIDTVPPDTIITSGPPNPSFALPGSFNFSSYDGSATFECSMDAAPYAACSSPYTFGGLSPGSHTFSVRAKDPSGNTDPTPASSTWTVLAPDTTITAAPLNPSDSPSGSFSFTANLESATFECRLDTGNYSACTSPFSFGGLNAGNHTFSVRAKDPVGNVDPTPATFSWVINSNVALVLPGGATSYYTIIGQAYAAIPNNSAATMKLRGVDFTESILCDRNITLTLRGGFDDIFYYIPGVTTIHGDLVISAGSVVVDNVEIM